MVFRGQAQLRRFAQQALQQFALVDGQHQAGGICRHAGNLMDPQLALGLVGHQQHHPLHAAGDQGVAGKGGQVDGIAERAGLGQQLAAELAPDTQGLSRRGRRGDLTLVQALLMPRPEQGFGRVEQAWAGVMTGADRGLLVHQLLHVVQRSLQVKAGEQLPALHVRIGPAHLRGQGQAVGQ
ncbi:hypothetical protein D9M71_598190 [compost metagenome]